LLILELKKSNFCYILLTNIIHTSPSLHHYHHQQQPAGTIMLKEKLISFIEEDRGSGDITTGAVLKGRDEDFTALGRKTL